MTNEELITAVRLAIREEVGASEHRTIVRLDKMDEHLENFGLAQQQVGKDIAQINGNVGVLQADMTLLRADVTDLKKDMGKMNEEVEELKKAMGKVKDEVRWLKSEMRQVESILNDATVEINELKNAQYNLENKVDEHTKFARRELQKFSEYLQSTNTEFLQMLSSLNQHLTLHENLPAYKAHPFNASNQ